MNLIIDCGSTKAEWAIIKDKKLLKRFVTDGFNPNYTDKNNILSITLNELSYKPFIQDITDLFYYGSGCADEQNCEIIKEFLLSIFFKAKITVNSDILSACHALLGNKKGIACILGTGSNSCCYDGGKIVENAVSLGYILGDDGGGDYIGKTLIRDYFYGKMPLELRKEFENEYDINVKSFVNTLYHEIQPAKYLGSFAVFAGKHQNNSYIEKLCNQCFDDFIKNFILRFKSCYDYEINFVGSVAYHFQNILKKRLTSYGLKTGKILKDPMPGLIDYYTRIPSLI